MKVIISVALFAFVAVQIRAASIASADEPKEPVAAGSDAPATVEGVKGKGVSHHAALKEASPKEKHARGATAPTEGADGKADAHHAASSEVSPKEKHVWAATAATETKTEVSNAEAAGAEGAAKAAKAVTAEPEKPTTEARRK